MGGREASVRTVGCLKLKKLGLRLGVVLVEVKGRFEGGLKRKARNAKPKWADFTIIDSAGLGKCQWTNSFLPWFTNLGVFGFYRFLSLCPRHHVIAKHLYPYGL